MVLIFPNLPDSYKHLYMYLIKYHYLACFLRLGTGWSVHTEKFTKFNKGDQLSMEEQDHIMNVISKAEYLEQTEQERIG